MNLFNLAAEIVLDDKDYNEGLKKAEDTTKATAKNMVVSFKDIESAVSQVTQFATKLFNSLKSIFNSVIENADAIDKMSQRLGISRKAYQEWDYILEQTGGSISTMTTAMRSLTKSLSNSSSAGSKALRKLGLDVKDLKSKKPEEAFEDIIKRLQEMPEGLEKSKAAMDIFGRQGMELLPLLNQGAGSLDEFKKRAQELGIILEDDAVDAGVDLKDAMDEVKRTLKAVATIIVQYLLPTFKKVAEFISKNLVPTFKKYENILKPVIIAVLALIAALVVMAGLIKVVLLIKAMVISLKALKGALILVKIATWLFNAALWANPIVWVVAAVLALIAAIGFMIYAFTRGTETMKKWALVILSLLLPIVGIPLLIKKMWPQLKEAGSNIIRGLWEGIKSMFTWLVDKLKEFFTNIVEGIKEFFGISSPSKLFEDLIGKNLALGIGVGFEDEMPKVDDMMMDSLQNSSESIDEDTGSPTSSKSDGIVINITYHINQELSPSEIARRTRNDLATLFLRSKLR